MSAKNAPMMGPKFMARYLERGQRWKDDVGPVRIMAVVDSYVVVRRPRTKPFLLTLRDFESKFVRL